jgi:hypothetical protein
MVHAQISVFFKTDLCALTLAVFMVAGSAEYALAKTQAECKRDYNALRDSCDIQERGSAKYEGCVGRAGTYFTDCINTASDKNKPTSKEPTGSTGTSKGGVIHHPPGGTTVIH